MVLAVNLEAVAFLLVGALAGHYVVAHYKRTGRPF